MNLRLHRFRLPLRHPFTISRGTISVQQTLVVELEQDGRSGFGEAPEVGFYGATLDRVAAEIQQVRGRVEQWRLGDPAELWQALRSALADAPFAQCALDTAAWDLWGKLQGAPLWQLWGLAPEDCPKSSYTLGIDTPEKMVAKLQEFAGWPIYKIKLGTAEDVGLVRRLREHTRAVLRVDANCAWQVEETLLKAEALRGLGVELIEQPLPAECWHEMHRLRRQCALPLVADESCQTEADVERCAGCFHGINIKLVKCGGLTPARSMVWRAKELGLKVMIGCFVQSVVGISAAAQLLPLADYADVDGAVLLAEDVAAGVRLERGRVIFPDRPGCGVRLLRSGEERG